MQPPLISVVNGGLTDPLHHRPPLVVGVGDLEFFDRLRDGLLGIGAQTRPMKAAGVDLMRMVRHS